MDLSNIHTSEENSRYIEERKIRLFNSDTCGYAVILLGNKNNTYHLDVTAYDVDYEIIIREEWIADWRIRYCPKGEQHEIDSLNFVALGKMSINGEYIQLRTNSPDKLNNFIEIKKITIKNDSDDNTIANIAYGNEYALIIHEHKQLTTELISTKNDISDMKKVGYETIFDPKNWNKKYCMVFNNNSDIIAFEVLSVGRSSDMVDHIDAVIYYKWNKIHITNIKMVPDNKDNYFNAAVLFDVEYINTDTKMTETINIYDRCAIVG